MTRGQKKNGQENLLAGLNPFCFLVAKFDLMLLSLEKIERIAYAMWTAKSNFVHPLTRFVSLIQVRYPLLDHTFQEFDFRNIHVYIPHT